MSTRIRERFLLAFCLVVVALVSSAAMAAVQVHFHDGFEPYTPLHVQMQVISQSFNATPKEIRLAARDLDTIDEMTVAFFLSRESGKKIQRVLRRRASGESWWQLMQELDVGASWLYRDNLLQLRSTWNSKVSSVRKVAFKPMKDARFEDLVGAQVTSEYFHTTPSLVLDARAEGKSFRAIQSAFYYEMENSRNGALRLPGDDRQLGPRRRRTQTSHPVPVEAATVPPSRVHKRPPIE